MPESDFARFRDWTARYVVADPTAKSGLVGEGVVLAKARREDLAGLIRSDPQRATVLAAVFRFPRFDRRVL